MSYDDPGKTISRLADADFSVSATHQYRGVIFAAGGEFTTVTGAGVDILGALQNDPVSGAEGTIMVNGITKARAGAAVTEGDIVMVDADGDFITATATNKGVGFAMRAAGAAGELFPVLLMNLGTQ